MSCAGERNRKRNRIASDRGKMSYVAAEVFVGIRYNLSMNSPTRTAITSRVIRPGSSVAEESFWDTVTAAERIDGVWELTLLCLAWQPNQAHEPRLQRSISRIQRPRS